LFWWAVQDDGSGVQTLSVSAAADPYGFTGAVSSLGVVGAAGVTAGHVPSNSVRLLIAGSQAGGLIGVSGQNIEKIRNSSGATITVLAPNQLPLCASALESDRLVQVRLVLFYFYYIKVHCPLSCCFLASVLESLLCMDCSNRALSIWGESLGLFFSVLCVASNVIGSLRLIQCNGPSTTRSM